MNDEQIRQWATLLGIGKPIVSSGQWLTFRCPLAIWKHEKGTDKNPSFGIKNTPGPSSRVHCFSCNYSGDLEKFMLVLRHYSKGTEYDFGFAAAASYMVQVEEGSDLSFPLLQDEGNKPPQGDLAFPEDWLEQFQSVSEVQEAIDYLTGRDMPQVVADALDLRWSTFEKRVCFPIRNWSGQLCGLHGRTVIPGYEPRYRMMRYNEMKNPMVWMGEFTVTDDRPVVFAESVFDLARIYQVYRNVMTPLTASLSKEKVLRVQRITDVITFFDADKAGDQARLRVKSVLKGATVQHCYPPLGKDAGDMTVSEVVELLKPFVDTDTEL